MFWGQANHRLNIPICGWIFKEGRLGEGSMKVKQQFARPWVSYQLLGVFDLCFSLSQEPLSVESRNFATIVDRG